MIDPSDKEEEGGNVVYFPWKGRVSMRYNMDG